MKRLPRISIITPSYNQAAFIEQTIQSVLNQDYPDLEYIVMDGGSTDGTLEILKKYSGQLTWTSEPDRGQSHAINKGFSMATGEVLAFLNSDDLYEPGALIKVGQFFAKNPEAAWLTGRCHIIDKDGKEIRKAITSYKNFWLRMGGYRTLQILNFISQPATFWRRKVIEAIGFFDESLIYAMDYDFSLRVGKRYHWKALHTYLASFRVHSSSKAGSSVSAQFDADLLIIRRHTSSKLIVNLHTSHNSLITGMYRRMIPQWGISKQLHP
jgi:glycosyltransferase involved in cell wall biosynthesis